MSVVSSEIKHTEKKAFVVKIKDELADMRKTLEGEMQMKHLLLKKIKDLTTTQKNMRKEIDKVESEKGNVAEMLQSQEIMISELIAREPEKVKKLKIQKNELQRHEILKNKLQTWDLNNQKMVNEIEKLKSELGQEKEEKDRISLTMNEQIQQLKRTISDKDDYVAKQTEILQLTQKRNKNLMEEELQLKELLTQKDAINCSLNDEIKTLKEKLEEKERKNIIQQEECERLKESVSILIANELKSRAERNQNENTIFNLKEELKTKAIQTWNIQQQMVSSRNIMAQTITKMTIKSAQGVVQSEEMFKKMENENHILQLKASNLRDELTNSQNHINETEAQLHEVEDKLANAEAIAAAQLTDVQSELEEAVKKRPVIMEMLQTSESAKSELIDVNRRMKEEISVQNDKVNEMEAKIHNITKMLKEEKKRNKDQIEEISALESHMKTIEEELNKRKRKKKSRPTRLFRYIFRA